MGYPWTGDNVQMFRMRATFVVLCNGWDDELHGPMRLEMGFAGAFYSG